MMVSSFNIANMYMLVLDGHGYAWRGVGGSFLVDACTSMAAIVILAAALGWIGRAKQQTASAE